MAFFASPAKPWLRNKLKERNQHALQPKSKAENPMVGLGLPADPAKAIDEAIQEINNEVELRRQRGQSISVPTGAEMKATVEDKLGKKL